MKLSLKLLDKHHQTDQYKLQKPFFLRAKIPVTVFGLPFISAFSTSDHHPSDLSLRSNFPSGPSLKLSYTPTSTTTHATSPPPPLTLTLKSGTSLFGSPINSPLIISAHFSFSPLNSNNPNPTFSLQFKPRLGDFSLRKTTNSNPNPNNKPNGDFNSVGFLPLEGPRVWKDLELESSGKDPIFSGILVMANTKMPVAKRLVVNCRWGVNFGTDFGKKMPVLSVNKIGIERVDEVKEVTGVEQKGTEGAVGDSEMLKGMVSWMRRELDVLQRENREMRHKLEELKLGNSTRNNAGWKKPMQGVENSSGFESWRSKKSGGDEENQEKDSKKKVNSVSDVESELQRAIKAASSS